MRIENEAAYVLESRPYRETSLLLEMLTAEHGRIAMVARGVRGDRPRQRLKRAGLEPFRRLRIDFSGRGEVLSLTRLDTEGGIVRPVGKALLTAIYVNELIQKLTGRNDPSAGLFPLYEHWLRRFASCLSSSPGSPGLALDVDDRAALAWSLRRFERDLLALLGYGLALDHECDSGLPLEPAADYILDPEQGARSGSDTSIWPRVKGATLLAWAGETCPDEATAVDLKKLARIVIRHHLGGVELRAWQMASHWR